MTLRSIEPGELKLTLTNTPEELSNLSSLDIGLSGDGIKNYRFKLGRAENIDCSVMSGYGNPVGIDTNITASLAGLPDAELRLCVIASNIYDKWQPLSIATEVRWTKDTTAPVVALTFPNKDDLSVGYKAKVDGSCTTDDGTTEIKFTSGATEITESFDCSTGSFTQYIDVSSLSVGEVNFELSQTDAAGNAHSITRTLRKHTNDCDSLAARQKTAAQGFAGGNGALGDPYTICTTNQLNEIRNTSDKFFQLGNDLYFEAGDSNGDFLANGSDTDYTSGEGWLPLSAAVEYLEGNSHTIYGLRINRPATDNVGLLGSNTWVTIEDVQVIDAQVVGNYRVGILLGLTLNSPSHFFRIHLVDSSVTGGDEVGGILGHSSSGYIHSSHAINLTVTGQSTVGGIVGRGNSGTYLFSTRVEGEVRGVSVVGGLTGERGTIYNSSANVTVLGTGNEVGGLSGRFTKIYSSYAQGTVSSTGTHVGCLSGGLADPGPRDSIAACESVTGASSVGFLMGLNLSTTNSFYSSSMNCTNTGGGTCNTGGATASSLESFHGDDHTIYSSWDFRANSTDGRSELWVSNPTSLPNHFFEVPYDFTPGLSGEGTAMSPYLISSVSDLIEVASNPFYQRAHLELTQNIDLSLASPGSFKGLSRYLPFEGSFDGGGYRVINLSIDESTAHGNNLGFFGMVLGQALVTNLHVHVDRLRGDAPVGALAGYSHSKNYMEKVGTSGTLIEATGNAGGLFGNGFSPVRYAESHINVQCTGGRCGGLIGWSSQSPISDSYATGNISGSSEVGGLIGTRQLGNSLVRTFATGSVTGSSGNIGGLVGTNHESTSLSFAVGDVTGNDASSQVGSVFGLGSATPNYYLNTATCTNSNGGCNTAGTAVGPLSYFYNKANPPLNSWDFDNVWQENAGALPSLRDMP